MSLFQCAKCGCIENTALTNCSHAVYLYNEGLKEFPNDPALLSYKELLGLKPEEPFQELCSACTPFWFYENGNYGVGKNPNPSPEEGDGVWHGKFERTFLPKGKFKTDKFGNLEHIETGDTDFIKYILLKEEGT